MLGHRVMDIKMSWMLLQVVNCNIYVIIPLYDNAIIHVAFYAHLSSR